MRKAIGGLALAVGLAVVVVLATREKPPLPLPARAPSEAPAEPAPAAPASMPPVEPAPAEPRDERAELAAALAADLAEHLPDRKLSTGELDAAAGALLRLREARRALAELPRTPENAERLRELTEELGRAAEDFEYVVDLDPAAFLRAVSDGAPR